MPLIFISHARHDKPIIDDFFDLLQTGCSIHGSDIFCTSVEGAGIETGEDFVKWIKEHIVKADLVILFVTPNYLNSKFCVAEMGAAWALEKKVFPLVIPDMPHEVGGVMLGKQTTYIDESGLDELYDRIREIFKEVKMPTSRWSLKKEQFLKFFRKKKNEVRKPEFVNQDELQREQERTNEAMLLYEEMNGENKELKERIKLLEQIKDKEEVDKIRKKFTSDSEYYENLLSNVREELSEFNDVVVRCIYAEIVEKPWMPSEYAARQHEKDIERAMDSEWIIEVFNNDIPGYYANRKHPKLTTTFEAIADLEQYIVHEMPEDLRGNLQRDQEYLIDISNREFWEKSLCRGYILD